MQVTGTIPNLVNGISQQSPSLRLPSQGAVCENFNPTVLDGLVPRPPSIHLGSLGIDLPAGTFTHYILRDENEKYILAILPDLSVRVYDLDGTAKTVTNSGAAYLAGVTDPENDLRALTIADHTFIVNKKRVVAASSATNPTRPFETLIEVKAGNYAKTYKIFTDGALRAEYTPPDGGDASHGPYVDTVYIADQLWQDLNTNGFNTAPWALGRYHSTLYIRNTDTDFGVSTEDGYSGRAMKEVKGTVQKFSDLPQYGPSGVILKVGGDGATTSDDYYVKFEKTNTTDGFGVWKECAGPGSKVGLDAATMPHILRRESDGTFTFLAATWDPRPCGDNDTNPDPSFVGQTIEDVFFYRNRLGFLTKENYVMSGAGDFYRFYRATMLTLLDTDPIDGAASHIKVSLLRHAVPFNETLLLFSDQTQFRLEGNELLTPKTVNAKPLSELNSINKVRPPVIGSSVYFVNEGTDWANLYEYFIDKQVQAAEDENVSSHAPAFIPAGVKRVIGSPELDLVGILTDGDPNAIYFYKFLWNGQEKLQSAWFSMRLPGVSRIVDATWDNRLLRLLVIRNGIAYSEVINMEQGVRDPDVDYVVHLDRRVAATGTYDPIARTTTVVLPYAPPPMIQLVAVTRPGGTLPDGVERRSIGIVGNTVTFQGNISGSPLWVGREYTQTYTFSPFYYRGQEGKIAVLDGRLQVYGMSINYAKSAYFQVLVENQGRPPITHTFAGRIVNDPDNVTNQFALDTDRFSIPILGRNDRISVSLINSSWRPCSFTSAQWRGTFNPLTRQL